MAGKLFVVSGPSGVGKGTTCRELLKIYDDIKLSISATTRKIREGEVNGQHYFFKTDEEFDKIIKDDGFLEWAEFNGNRYGTLHCVVDKMLHNDENVLLEIEVQGAMQVKEKAKDAIFIFIAPPHAEDLLARLYKRGTETEEQIQKRYAEAKRELALMGEYDYIIINKDIKTATNELKEIIKNNK